MKKKQLRERIEYIMRIKKIESVSDIVPLGSPLYQKVYRQLFNNKDADITYDVLLSILEKYPDISSDYLIRGEGTWDRRTNIVTTHKQDIHVDGGQAAISQSGSATIDAPKEQQTSEPDIATMIRNNDLGGLVAIIMQQKDEIIRLKEQRIRDLEQSVRIADANIFPPVK